MQKYIVPSLSEPVGLLWKNLQEEFTKNGTFSVAAPLSSTPLPIYEWVIAHADTFSNWNKTEFILMDEMVEGIPPSVVYINKHDGASYEGFADKHLLTPIEEKVGVKIKVRKPTLSTLDNFKPKINLLILALGLDGNYANVMPGTERKVGWHVAHLSEEYRHIHTSASGAYAGSEFREYGMSLGPEQVIQADQIVVIISGKKKHDLTEKLLSYDHFDPNFPLSIIFESEVQRKVRVYITEDVEVSTA